MKYLRNSLVFLMLVTLVACSNRSGTPSVGDAHGSSPTINPQVTPRPKPAKPPKVSSIETVSVVTFDNLPLVIDSIAQLTKSSGRETIRELSKISFRGEVGYLERSAVILEKNGMRRIRLTAEPYYSLWWPTMKRASASDFDLAKKHVRVNKLYRVKIDLQPVYETVAVQFHLWTYRCKTAREYHSVAAEFPLIRKNLLFSVPKLFAIDALTETRLTAIEFNIMSKRLVSFPSKILFPAKEAIHDNGQPMYGTMLTDYKERLNGEVNLYDPSPIYEFFETCSGFYFDNYGPQKAVAPYAPYFPTRNVSLERRLLNGSALLGVWGRIYRHLLTADFQPIEWPNLSVIPSAENLSPKDRAYLFKNNFEIPSTKDFL